MRITKILKNLLSLHLFLIILLCFGSCGGKGTKDSVTTDTSPPTVLSVSPVTNATDVLTATEISVTFSEAMSQTAAQDAFSISPSVTGAFTWNMNAMTFDPTGALDGSTLYTCTISTAAKDSADNALASQYQWSFTTAPVLLNPALVSSCNLGTSSGVYVAGSYAYVADSLYGLMIVNISNPATPNVTTYYTPPFQANTVNVAGNYAYVTDNSSNLRIFDITDPADPIQKSSTNGWNPQDVQVIGNYAYVANGGLKIIDVSDPVNPSEVGSCITSQSNCRIYVAGNYAYVADVANSPAGVLTIIDISTPASPTLAGTYNTPGAATKDVYVVGNYAYVADGNGILEIIDITDKANPTLSSSCDPLGFANTVYVSGNYAYVLLDGGQMKIINIYNPAAPVLVGSYASTAARGIYVSGSYAYIVDQQTPISKLLVIGGIQ